MHEDDEEKPPQNITINFNINNIHKIDETEFKKVLTEIEELKSQLEKKPSKVNRLTEISKLVIDGSKAVAIILFIIVMAFELINSIQGGGTISDFFNRIKDLIKK